MGTKFPAVAALTLAAWAAATEPAWLQQFSSLPPQGQLAAYRLMAEWEALATAAAAYEAAGQDQLLLAALAAQKQRLLCGLLPNLDAAASEPAQLQTQAVGALAEQLAGRPAAQPSRLARALTLVNIAWFAGCVLLVAAIVSLAGAYLAALVMLIPLPAWEAVGYAASLWVLHAAMHSAPSTAPYVGLTGLLMMTATICGSLALHLAKRIKNSETAAAMLMGGFSLLYALVAVRLQSTLLGTLAVWWVMSALGFSIFVFPFLTVVGFRNGLLAPFAASLALLLAFLPFKAAPHSLPTPPWLRPFEPGVWLWCTLCLNLANLILAHRQWQNSSSGPAVPAEAWAQLPLGIRIRIMLHCARRFLVSQVPAVAVLGGTLACGVLLDVEPCRSVGAVFGFLWFMSKLSECDWRRVGFAWAALVFGSLLWGAAWAVHRWPHVLMLGAGARPV